MLDVMSQAKNAIEAYNAALKISSSNLANMNVPGYKSLKSSFQSVFERILSQGTAGTTDQGGTNPRQLGQGMSIAGTSVDFSNGDTTGGTPIDLAIAGPGLFIVSGDNGVSYLYSRAGNFNVDSDGNLTSNGLQVYGLDNSGNLTPISGLPSGVKTDYRWLDDGTLQYTADGGTTYTDTGYHIALTTFPNPSGLAQAQGTSFAATLASGTATNPTTPGGSAGIIKPGQVEQSNVVYLSETIYSLELQRALSGNLSMVRMASDLISSVIQKLG
ncbi:MAG: flagellar hook-basal body complex protein [Candidatus Margulisbacteria bacterium]|jgi:flagellar hook protein FlgE|nr:flagellar hook-basal body complex protein [Candidatus Margulisiibacteriota bacterium]